MQSAKGVAVSLSVAPVAQLDRAPGYEEVKEWFDSRRFGRRISSLGEEGFPHGTRSDQGVTKRRYRRAGRSDGKLVELKNAPVAQLDRVLGYEPRGREFESLQARHLFDLKDISASSRMWSSCDFQLRLCEPKSQ
jgi:hypothetical protein